MVLNGVGVVLVCNVELGVRVLEEEEADLIDDDDVEVADAFGVVINGMLAGEFPLGGFVAIVLFFATKGDEGGMCTV